MEKGFKNTALKLLRLLATWMRHEVFLCVCRLMTAAAEYTLEWLNDW